jgi:5'-nucleotidase (lipoprotein e(P4) family)
MWILLAALAASPALAADEGPSFDHSSVTAGENLKWVRDSTEFAWLTTQTYRLAAESVKRQSKRLKKGKWAVVLDVDETVLDNSTYQLERAAYGVGYEKGSWYAWCERRAATPVPGVKHLLDAVRDAGGKVVFITNRDEVSRTATRDNLAAYDLFVEGDTLCLGDENDETYTKVARRADARAGEGRCNPGNPVQVVAYFGDNIHDFPDAGEEDVDWGAQFGERYFVLPNPLYGGWARGVTRDLP